MHPSVWSQCQQCPKINYFTTNKIIRSLFLTLVRGSKKTILISQVGLSHFLYPLYAPGSRQSSSTLQSAGKASLPGERRRSFSLSFQETKTNIKNESFLSVPENTSALLNMYSSLYICFSSYIYCTFL